MNITVQQGEIQKQHRDAVVVNLFAGASPSGATGAVDAALAGSISAAIDLGDFRGESGESLLLYTNGLIAAPARPRSARTPPGFLLTMKRWPPSYYKPESKVMNGSGACRCGPNTASRSKAISPI